MRDMDINARKITATVALAVGATLALPAGQVIAAADPPINGYIYASGEWTSSCTEHSSGDPLAYKRVTSQTGTRTVASSQGVSWDGAGGGTEVTGRYDTSTKGVPKVRRGALDSYRLAGTTKVRLRNESAEDCGTTMWAVAFTSTELKVKRKGKIRISWDHGAAGDLTDVVLSRDAEVLVNRDPAARKGKLTVDVMPGRYGLYLRYHTGLAEAAVPAGKARTKRSAYSVTVSYVR